jgi:glutaconyl-CoA decarboxylase
MATYRVRADGKEYTVEVVDHPSGSATATVDGKSFEVEATASRPPALQPAAVPSAPVAAPASHPVTPPPAAAGSGSIVAPIPGVVTVILVKLGDQVSVNQIVLRLEAMKMENDIATPTSGIVKEIAISAGSEVSDGQLLMTIG